MATERSIIVSLVLTDEELASINWWRTNSASEYTDINKIEEIIHDIFEQVVEPHIAELEANWE